MSARDIDLGYLHDFLSCPAGKVIHKVQVYCICYYPSVGNSRPCGPQFNRAVALIIELPIDKSSAKVRIIILLEGNRGSHVASERLSQSRIAHSSFTISEVMN